MIARAETFVGCEVQYRGATMRVVGFDPKTMLASLDDGGGHQIVAPARAIQIRVPKAALRGAKGVSL